MPAFLPAYLPTSRGVRLDNACKNIGHPKFAFNKIQKSTLPPEYRPPDSTLGGIGGPAT
jgi:hypothetical protein